MFLNKPNTVGKELRRFPQNNLIHGPVSGRRAPLCKTRRGVPHCEAKRQVSLQKVPQAREPRGHPSEAAEPSCFPGCILKVATDRPRNECLSMSYSEPSNPNPCQLCPINQTVSNQPPNAERRSSQTTFVKKAQHML